MSEAQLEDSGSGLAPTTEGWFVVNVRDVEWWFADSRGAFDSSAARTGEINPPTVLSDETEVDYESPCFARTVIRAAGCCPRC